jgi:hypothetical protein
MVVREALSKHSQVSVRRRCDVCTHSYPSRCWCIPNHMHGISSKDGGGGGRGLGTQKFQRVSAPANGRHPNTQTPINRHQWQASNQIQLDWQVILVNSNKGHDAAAASGDDSVSVHTPPKRHGPAYLRAHTYPMGQAALKQSVAYGGNEGRCRIVSQNLNQLAKVGQKQVYTELIVCRLQLSRRIPT